MLEGTQTAALNSEDEEDATEMYLYGSCALKNTFLDWARKPANSTTRAKSAPPRMTQPHYSKGPGLSCDVAQECEGGKPDIAGDNFGSSGIGFDDPFEPAEQDLYSPYSCGAGLSQ
eukprot:7016618-Karenia_brevis.AAC.1